MLLIRRVNVTLNPKDNAMNHVKERIFKWMQGLGCRETSGRTGSFTCHGGLWVNKRAASHRGSSLHTSPQDDSLGHKSGGEISR